MSKMKTGNLGGGDLISRWLLPIRFIKNGILYSLKGWKWDRVKKKSYHTMRWGKQEPNRQCCTKGTQDISSVSQTWLLSSLGTDNHCILGGEYEFPGSRTGFPKGLALGHTWPCQACFDFGQETKLLLHTSAQLQESLRQIWPPTKLALKYKCNCPSVSYWS